MPDLFLVLLQELPSLEPTSVTAVLAWIVGALTTAIFGMAAWIVKFLTGHIQKNNDTMKDLIHAIENLRTVVVERK